VVELFGPFEARFNLFFSELQRLFINDLVTSLFARVYAPGEDIVQLGSHVPIVMFIMKG
jgi:hypothetical protein